MDFHTSLIYTFNKFFYDMIKDLKTQCKHLTKDYKVKVYTTDSNIELFNQNLDDITFERLVECDSSNVLSDESLQKFEPLKNVSIKSIVSTTSKDFNDTLCSYLYILTLLTIIHRQDEESAESLFKTVMGALRQIQSEESYEDEIRDLFDDDIKTLIDKASKVMKKLKTVVDEPSGNESLNSSFLENTKIGSLAKEITNEINLDDLKIEKPEDLLSAGNTNIIGNIMTKVGSKLNEKMVKGELKHEDLIQEAFSLMGSMQKGNPLFNNPMVQNMMKNKNNVKLNEAKLKEMSTKDRLRKKHEERYGK